MKLENVSISSIASCMGLSPESLCAIAKHSENLFFPTEIRTIKGKQRELDIPKFQWMGKFKKLNDYLARELHLHPAAHGGIRKRSPFTCARKHLGHECVTSIDIQNCFPSISKIDLYRELRVQGFGKNLTKVLSGLFTVRNRIPQGSPLSNTAINLYLRRLDRKISRKAAKLDVAYGRFCDDFPLSGAPRRVSVAAAYAERQIADIGLVVNEKKKLEKGMQLRNKEQLVLNIKVNDSRGTEIPVVMSSKFIDLSKDYVSSAIRVNPATLPSLKLKRERLLGCICQCMQAEHSPVRLLNRRLKKGDRAVLHRLSEVSLVPYRKKWWSESKNSSVSSLSYTWRNKLRRFDDPESRVAAQTGMNSEN